MEIEERISNLEKKMDYQEHIHRDISLDPNGFIHGVVTNLPMIITAIVLSVIAVLLVNKFNK